VIQFGARKARAAVLDDAARADVQLAWGTLAESGYGIATSNAVTRAAVREAASKGGPAVSGPR
jgi:hypothetical protein